MKARIKKGPNAGREIEVYKFDDWCYRNSKSGKIYQKEELDFSENTTDWDSFRREAAKEFLAGLCANGSICSLGDAISFAIQLADELIKQLKEERK